MPPGELSLFFSDGIEHLIKEKMIREINGNEIDSQTVKHRCNGSEGDENPPMLNAEFLLPLLAMIKIHL